MIRLGGRFVPLTILVDPLMFAVGPLVSPQMGGFCQMRSGFIFVYALLVCESGCLALKGVCGAMVPELRLKNLNAAFDLLVLSAARRIGCGSCRQYNSLLENHVSR